MPPVSGGISRWSPQPIDNLFGVAIREYADFSTVRSYFDDPGMFVAGLLLFLLQCVVLIVSILLWPYGWIFVVTHTLWQLISYTAARISPSKPLVAIAIGMTLLLYGVCLLIFVLLSTPGYLLFLVGLVIAHVAKHPASMDQIAGYGVLIAVGLLIIVGIFGGAAVAPIIATALIGAISAAVANAIEQTDRTNQTNHQVPDPVRSSDKSPYEGEPRR